ncbi:MAG TPA: hypothetical protein VFF73_24650 [Planctomycetota bacterium]|nr:hypothetical protein [Planctomycetota bacterium]
MRHRLALVLVLGLALVARAGDAWKEPENGALTDKLVQDYVSYLETFKKLGGTWHAQTTYLTSDLERKAIGQAGLDRDAILFAKPRVDHIARVLVVKAAKSEVWTAAHKRAEEKLAGAKKKMEDLMKNGPKEIGELDKVNVDLSGLDRSTSKLLVTTIIDRLKKKAKEKEAADAKDAGAKKKAQEDADALEAQLKKETDEFLKSMQKLDGLLNQQLDLREKLEKVGATDGLKAVATAADARRDIEEVEANQKESDTIQLDPVLKPSVEVVRSKLDAIKKALAELGSPTFAAVK